MGKLNVTVSGRGYRSFLTAYGSLFPSDSIVTVGGDIYKVKHGTLGKLNKKMQFVGPVKRPGEVLYNMPWIVEFSKEAAR